MCVKFCKYIFLPFYWIYFDKWKQFQPIISVWKWNINLSVFFRLRFMQNIEFFPNWIINLSKIFSYFTKIQYFQVCLLFSVVNDLLYELVYTTTLCLIIISIHIKYYFFVHFQLTDTFLIGFGLMMNNFLFDPFFLTEFSQMK